MVCVVHCLVTFAAAGQEHPGGLISIEQRVSESLFGPPGISFSHILLLAQRTASSATERIDTDQFAPFRSSRPRNSRAIHWPWSPCTEMSYHRSARLSLPGNSSTRRRCFCTMHRGQDSLDCLRSLQRRARSCLLQDIRYVT